MFYGCISRNLGNALPLAPSDNGSLLRLRPIPCSRLGPPLPCSHLGPPLSPDLSKYLEYTNFLCCLKSSSITAVGRSSNWSSLHKYSYQWLTTIIIINNKNEYVFINILTNWKISVLSMAIDWDWAKLGLNKSGVFKWSLKAVSCLRICLLVCFSPK